MSSSFWEAVDDHVLTQCITEVSHFASTRKYVTVFDRRFDKYLEGWSVRFLVIFKISRSKWEDIWRRKLTFRRSPQWACCVSRASEAYHTRHFFSSYSSTLSPPVKPTLFAASNKMEKTANLHGGVAKKIHCLARATSISLFCCHSSADRFEVLRRFTEQLIGPLWDMALISNKNHLLGYFSLQCTCDRFTLIPYSTREINRHGKS